MDIYLPANAAIGNYISLTTKITSPAMAPNVVDSQLNLLLLVKDVSYIKGSLAIIQINRH